MDKLKNRKVSVNVKLDTNLQLQEMSNRIVDVVNEIGAYYNVLSNEMTKPSIKKVVLN